LRAYGAKDHNQHVIEGFGYALRNRVSFRLSKHHAWVPGGDRPMSKLDFNVMKREKESRPNAECFDLRPYDHTFYSVALFAFIEQKGTGMRWLL